MRLFPEIKFGADKQASTVFSKWFGRLLDSAQITDPAVVFHSFRHGIEDALRNGLQQQYIIDQIMGHSSSAISAQYGDGANLSVLSNAIKTMDIVFDTRQVLKLCNQGTK